ncbi:hypothetical protein ACFFOS_04615 [Nocardioides kongjuensis]|uniref:Uncharacterized protein n=1 Tax=Nocardioides kongjuensis TaxID=349522 RepID=A0A852RAV7_9ACTN|nr:hypothetical protein [Nocardioides kongjuensis]NYD30207.1 hypothetical protein [Nocardioides kongjuensis]
MDVLGTRLGVLCPSLALLVAVLTGCSNGVDGEADLRTPPARDRPTGHAGDLAGRGAEGLGAY